MMLVSGSMCLTLWLLSPSVAVLILFASLYGFCSGFFVALLPACVSQICAADRIGAQMGAFYSIASISSLVGNPVAGLLIGGGGKQGYQGLIAYAVGFLYDLTDYWLTKRRALCWLWLV